MDKIRRLISQGFRTARNPNGFLVGNRKVYQQVDGTPKRASILKQLDLIERASQLRASEISAVIKKPGARERLIRKVERLLSLQDEIE